MGDEDVTQIATEWRARTRLTRIKPLIATIRA
jgi:hypothetical protein